MRWLAVLLLPALPALPALAEDADAEVRIRASLNGEEWAKALAQVDAALDHDPSSGVLLRMRAEAHRGVARDLQRTQGYPAAIAYLERHLDHPVTAWAYARTCIWGGEERRGIDGLRESGLPPADTIPGEVELLSQLRRYDEVVQRASLLEAEYPAWAHDWTQWAGKAAEQRERLEERARRAAWVTAVGGLVFVGGALLVAWLTRRPTAASC